MKLTVAADFLCNKDHRKKDGSTYSPDTLRKNFDAVFQNTKHRCSQAKLQFGPDNKTLSKVAYNLHQLASSRTQREVRTRQSIKPKNITTLWTHWAHQWPSPGYFQDTVR